MSNKITLKKCNLDGNNKIITAEVVVNDKDTNTIYINVGDEKNDEHILDIIDKANRHYAAIMFDLGRTNSQASYGCLTSKVVGLADVPLTYLNPKYIINVFLQILQCIFKDDPHYLKYCIRDDESLYIPTSEENISSLVDKLMNICNENNDNNMDDEEDTIDIKDMFMLLLDYILKIQSNNHKKLNNGNLQKKISLMGGGIQCRLFTKFFKG